MASKYLWPEKPALIGTSVRRLDGPDKVTGRARYTYDINRPGMIYGKMVRSPHAHAKVVSVDPAEAAKAKGVLAVLTAAEWQAVDAWLPTLSDGFVGLVFEGVPVWQMLVHVVNHGTQHRAEAAALLTTEGRSPGELDMINYAEEQAAGAGGDAG